ncbi:MFS transporter, siderophore-iron transporter [Pseudohyphozyma bogoriensis]|nr:MFS transporter, siderophore-iron transporter [Pseudohyphozyma bogoriensis]
MSTAAENSKAPSVVSDEEKHSNPDTQGQKEVVHDEAALAGVARIEALYTVFGAKKIWLLYISIGLISYVYSLQQNTTYAYLQFATSSFGEHSILGAISVATTVISAVSRPFIAKIADLTSRPYAYLFALVTYCVGMILMAASKNVNTVAAGQILYYLGSAGIDQVTSIIVADVSPLKWRGMFQGICSSPYIINAFISGYITSGIGGASSWRWGYGMWAVITPTVMAPALMVLFWADIKAKRIGVISASTSNYAVRQQVLGHEKKSWLSMALYYLEIIDGVGLLLLGFAFSLILLPFSLYADAKGGWNNASMIAMEVVGWIILAGFVAWEWKYSKHPLMPKRCLNRTFIGCAIIDTLYEFSGYLPLYYSSWVYVQKDWSYRNYTFWGNTLSVGLCFFGLVSGAAQRYTHNGVGLQFYGFGEHATDGVLVAAQIVISIGGGFSVVGTQVGSQGSVPHADTATIIALLSLCSQLGAAAGDAAAACIWTNKVPKALEKHLGAIANSTVIDGIYGDITSAKDAAPAIRAGALQAYTDALQYPSLLPALILCIVPLGACFMCRDYYLGDNQNDIEESKQLHLKRADHTDSQAAEDEKIHI